MRRINCIESNSRFLESFAYAVSCVPFCSQGFVMMVSNYCSTENSRLIPDGTEVCNYDAVYQRYIDLFVFVAAVASADWW